MSERDNGAVGVGDDVVREEIERARRVGRALDARAARADDGSETQRAMRLGAKVARRQAFRILIEHWCGPGAYEELGFAGPRVGTEPLEPVTRPIRCTCGDLRPVAELAVEAGVSLDVQEARSAGFTRCDAVLGCQNPLEDGPGPGGNGTPRAMA